MVSVCDFIRWLRIHFQFIGDCVQYFSGSSGVELPCNRTVITDGWWIPQTHTYTYTHMQLTVEVENVKLYRQIPAKQLCTRNEFSQCSVLPTGWQNYWQVVGLSWCSTSSIKSGSRGILLTYSVELAQSWMNRNTCVVMTHIICTRLQTAWTLTSDAVVNVRCGLFFPTAQWSL